METALKGYEEQLREQEKSPATIEKYLRDVRAFLKYAGAAWGKETVIGYKRYLQETYAPASVNSMLTAVNGYLRYLGRPECQVKLLRIQRQIFLQEEKELSREEYRRLVAAAGKRRIGYILQTLCGTGIRVSELQYITAEAVRQGHAEVQCKNKTRVIIIPVSVQRLLKGYMKRAGIKTGSVFVTRGGKPLDRSNIWKEMKALCQRAGVKAEKVYPHNLRHLFARLFYRMEKDVVRLADILGHSSVNTTRIYTMDSLQNSRPSLDRLGKLLMTT